MINYIQRYPVRNHNDIKTLFAPNNEDKKHYTIFNDILPLPRSHHAAEGERIISYLESHNVTRGGDFLLRFPPHPDVPLYNMRWV
jgi:hypothetical protein